MRSTRPLPFHQPIVSCVAVALAALTAVTAPTVWARPPVSSAPSLLAASDGLVGAELSSAVRSRAVEIDAATLDTLATGRPVQLNLFDDVSFIASLRTTATAGAWRGSA